MPELLSQDDVFDVIGAYRLSAAVLAMADLAIPDALAAQPLTCIELAQQLGLDAGLLARLLDVLASRRAIGCDDSGRYVNSGLSSALVAGELRDLVLGWAGLPSVFSAWTRLAASVRSGEPPYRLAHGTDLHGYFHAFPDEGARYATAMSSTVDGFNDLARALDLNDGSTVVSVGGGRGAELVPVLQRWPDARGILTDLPDALDGAKDLLTR